MKKYTLILAAFFMAVIFAKAQTASKLTSLQKGYLQKTWYENPKESKGDTIVFHVAKYIYQSGDDPAFAWSELSFSNATDFNVAYWRWCVAPFAYTGKWSAGSNTSLKLDFGHQKCKCDLNIIDIQSNTLKVVIKESSN